MTKRKPQFDHLVFEQLARNFENSEGQLSELRWRWLMAAHIVGQLYIGLHWRNHVAMLRFALRNQDYPEVAGQLFRLMLVPLGHLLGKLPAGNIGRATVNAFHPMPLDPSLQRLISDTRKQILHGG